MVVMEDEAPLEKREHWRLAALMVCVQLLDFAVTDKLCSSGELNAAGVAVVQTFHYGSNFLLLLLLSLSLCLFHLSLSNFFLTCDCLNLFFIFRSRSLLPSLNASLNKAGYTAKLTKLFHT